MKNEEFKNEELADILKIMAPGTALREGLENIIRARTGALIVLADSNGIVELLDGGFFINKEYSSSHLYELAKMDGAILISKDVKRILYANTMLIPDTSISTMETGTKHKAADRFAKQTGEVVICISQRRNVITLFKNNKKYLMRNSSIVLAKANQALQTLEKYKNALDVAMNGLSLLEFEDVVTLEDVVNVIQRIELVLRISMEIEMYICELGNEGRLVNMQLNELMYNVEKDGELLIVDYKRIGYDKSVGYIIEKIREIPSHMLMEFNTIANILGFNSDDKDKIISPKGYRIISKIPKVPFTIVDNLVKEFNDFQGILRASINQLDDVDGIGEVRARKISEGLKRAQEHILIDSKQLIKFT